MDMHVLPRFIGMVFTIQIPAITSRRQDMIIIGMGNESGTSKCRSKSCTIGTIGRVDTVDPGSIVRCVFTAPKTPDGGSFGWLYWPALGVFPISGLGWHGDHLFPREHFDGCFRKDLRRKASLCALQADCQREKGSKEIGSAT